MNWKVEKYLLYNLQNLGMSECFCEMKHTILMVVIPSDDLFCKSFNLSSYAMAFEWECGMKSPSSE